MWECKKDGCKKASLYAECYSLSSLFLAIYFQPLNSLIKLKGENTFDMLWCTEFLFVHKIIICLHQSV